MVYLPTFSIKVNQMWVNIPVPWIVWVEQPVKLSKSKIWRLHVMHDDSKSSDSLAKKTWLVVSTHLKNISQIGIISPILGVKIKNV